MFLQSGETRIHRAGLRHLCSSVRRFRDDHHQGRMQIRLSARSSGVMESPRSGGGSDSELRRCAEDTDEQLRKKNLLADTTSQYRRNGICLSVGTLLQLRTCSRSDCTQRSSNAPWTHCGGASFRTGTKIRKSLTKGLKRSIRHPLANRKWPQQAT